MLAAAAVFEIAISLIGLLFERAEAYSFYFQPHIGLAMVEDSYFGSRWNGWSSLACGIVLLAAAGAISRNKKAAIAYVVAQSLYAVAVGFVLLAIALVDMSSAHGMSRQETVIPAAMLLAFVVVPVVVVLRHLFRPAGAVAADQTI